jgi:hypothetical protein
MQLVPLPEEEETLEAWKKKKQQKKEEKEKINKQLVFQHLFILPKTQRGWFFTEKKLIALKLAFR